MAAKAISRREFLQMSLTAGGGLLIGVALSACQNGTAPTPEATVVPIRTAEPTPERLVQLRFGAFLKIDTAGVVTIFLHKCELGQGVGTTLPMIVAEELDADWSQVQVEQVPVGDIYGKTTTSGSDSTQDLYMPLRQAGALARSMLVMAAAQIWDVPESTCATENGEVVHEPSGERLGYGALVETAATVEPPRSRDVEVKDEADFWLIGTRAARRDGAKIVDGSAIYGIDVRVPGMLYASIERCPVFGGSVAGFDATQAEQVPGVRQVVEIEGGVAVVADSTWAAWQGRRALEVTWDEGRSAELSTESIRQAFAERLPLENEDPNILEALYEMPFLAHVNPEPMNATADVREDGCDVWAPTQAPADAQRAAGQLTGFHGDEQIPVHIPYIGGGFGRRLQVDYVRQAVQVSQAVGAPVQMVWTREDDTQHDYYHPFSLNRPSATLDPPQMPRIRSMSAEGMITTGAWRGASNVTPGFVRECFVDEMAAALGRDPYELRMEMDEYRDLWEVLETAATRAGWGEPLPEGWGRGIAAFSTWNVTPTVHVVDVSVDSAGNVRVHRVVCAVDCGLVVNPDIVEAQMEGGIIFGLTVALKGEITLVNGRVEQSNLHDYPLLRNDEAPEIQVYIVPSDRLPSGVGEMAVPPILSAVANAVSAATGRRIRKLPIRLEIE